VYQKSLIDLCHFESEFGYFLVLTPLRLAAIVEIIFLVRDYF